MKPETYHRLQRLRLENDQAGFDQEAMRPRFERLANRHDNGTAPRAVTAYQLFQTPPDVAASMVESVEIEDEAVKRILEPSAGLGRLIDAARMRWPRADISAIEIEPKLTGELYDQLRPGVDLLQRDFLQQTPLGLGLFDVILMNPPFHMRSDIKHILHARSFLRPGGRLAAICMNTHHREQRLRPLCASWEVLPPSTFAETGTRVEAVQLTLKQD